MPTGMPTDLPTGLPTDLPKARGPINGRSKIACVKSLGIGRPFQLTVFTSVRGLLSDDFVRMLLAP